MRTPITLKIKFKSSSLDQFIERYSVDVSRGGIFIRTKEPLPVGTTLRFEFQLQDGSSLIGGEGTVVWNRAYDPARTGVAPGMGVRFDKLTADSQRVLDRILNEKHKRGEAQLESRFDAGVRASRESRPAEFLDPGTPLPAPVPGLQPGGHGFGEEPTRMMGAAQMDKLAKEMQKTEESFTDEQPTRRASMEEIQKAVTAPAAQGPLAAGRTGRTGEQVRLGGGLPASKISSMGPVIPALQNATVPATVREEPLPPSLSTRPVSAEQAALLIAASASESTPPKEIPLPEPSAKAGPTAPTGPVMLPVGKDVLPTHLSTTLVGSNAPPLRGLEKHESPTIKSPPPAESALFAGAGELPEPLRDPAGGPGEAEEAQAVGSGLADALASLRSAEDEAPTAMGRAAESPISIPISIAPVEKEAPAPDVPLNPQDFAQTSPALPATLEPTPLPQEIQERLSEASTGPRLASTPVAPTGGAARMVLLILIPLLALAVAGILVYGLFFQKKESDYRPQPQPASQQTALPVPPQPAAGTQGTQPEAQKPAATSQEGTKVGQPEGEHPATPPEATKEAAKPTGEGAEEEGKKPPAQKPMERVVEVNSTPHGAEVWLDGKRVGKTPMALKKLDMNKVHQIEVRKNGFAPQTRNISDTEAYEVKNGREVLMLNLVLEATAPQPKKEREERPAHERREPKKPQPEDKAAPGTGGTETQPPAEDKKQEAKPEAKQKAEPEQKGDTDKQDKTDKTDKTEMPAK